MNNDLQGFVGFVGFVRMWYYLSGSKSGVGIGRKLGTDPGAQSLTPNPNPNPNPNPRILVRVQRRLAVYKCRSSGLTLLDHILSTGGHT